MGTDVSPRQRTLRCALLAVILPVLGCTPKPDYGELSTGLPPEELPAAKGCVLIPYERFEPQAQSYEAVGHAWYQWDSHGDEREPYIFVVVYNEMSLSEVKRRYPVDPQRLQDFRYIQYHEAQRYLARWMEEAIKQRGPREPMHANPGLELYLRRLALSLDLQQMFMPRKK